MSQEIQTLSLYRPVGLKELDLILQSDGRAFPPRLPEQPIFYPVLNFDYAAQIAGKWNPKDERSGYAGFVTAFDVEKTYVDQFEVHTVGASIHQELWIPAEALNEFNAHIIGRIQVREAFYGDRYQGMIHPCDDMNAKAQMIALFKLQNSEAFHSAIHQKRNALIANFKFWILHVSPDDIFETQKMDFLHDVTAAWKTVHPDFHLPGSELLDNA